MPVYTAVRILNKIRCRVGVESTPTLHLFNTL